MSISALVFYNFSNRHTFSQIFRRDMTSTEALAKRREVVVDTIMRYVKKFSEHDTPPNQTEARQRSGGRRKGRT